MAFAVVTVVTFSAAPSAQAGTFATYLDGSFAQSVFVGPGQLAFVFADFAATGDNDIFTLHADSFANPLPLGMAGFQPALGYYLNFLFVDGFGNFVYDVYADQGFGWILIGQFLL